nr:transposase [Vibrio rotiferianus]
MTSEPVETHKFININSQRWRVEDYHKVWKRSAGAERQRMAESDNLERMVSILALVAVRQMNLRESLTLAVLPKCAYTR